MRALYRGETGRLREIIAEWPEDVRRYAGELMGPFDTPLRQGSAMTGY